LIASLSRWFNGHVPDLRADPVTTTGDGRVPAAGYWQPVGLAPQWACEENFREIFLKKTKILKRNYYSERISDKEFHL
jgi:hypothetical protein